MLRRETATLRGWGQSVLVAILGKGAARADASGGAAAQEGEA